MSRQTATVLIVALILLGIGVFFALRNSGDTIVIPPGNGAGNGNSNGGDNNNNGEDNPRVETSMVRVDYPRTNTEVSDPLTVVGSARGNWYFEASFPLRIIDANGRELGVSFAQAEGDWMTTEFVPFRGTITFTTPTTETGTLILEKDNPSGLPQNADEVRVPIRFGQTSSQTRNVALYFYDENKDNAQCSAQGLISFNRTIPLTNTPIQDSVRELLKGPTASERSQAPDTELPLPGVTLTGANLSNGVLTLSFNDPSNQSSGGSCRVSILRAQIETTAKQFGGVTSVRYEPVGVFEP